MPLTKLEETNPEFAKAVVDGRHLTSKPTNEDLLDAYGLFKQATQEPPLEEAPAPGMFDLKAKAKRSAWKKLVDKGVTPEMATEQYIAKIKEMMETYGYDPEKEPEAIGGQ